MSKVLREFAVCAGVAFGSRKARAKRLRISIRKYPGLIFGESSQRVAMIDRKAFSVAQSLSREEDVGITFEFLWDAIQSIWPFHLIVTSSSALVGCIAMHASKSLFLAPILTATPNPCIISLLPAPKICIPTIFSSLP